MAVSSQSLGERLGPIKYQIMATFFANVGCFGQGCAIGWASPFLPLLRSVDSPLPSGPISANASAWIGAILALGAISGTTLFGLLTNCIGSKRSLLLCGIPVMLHWIVVFYAREAWHLIMARFLCGLTGGGFFICIPLYVAEISNERIRGILSSMLQVSFNSGIVIGLTIGTYLDYYTMPPTLIVIPMLFAVLFVWLPQTPQYLLSCGQTQSAEKSLRFYRNVQPGVASDSQELMLRNELEKFILIAKQNAEMSSVNVSDFMNRQALRGLLIATTLLAVAQFSGTFTLINYASTIFRETGSDMDPNVSSLIIGVIQLIGTICASTFIDRLGRRSLLLISSAGSATALAITGTYAFLMPAATDMDIGAWSAVPVVSLSMFIFVSAVGLTPVPYVLMAEVLPQKIRRIGATICVCMVSVYAFVMLRYFPYLLDLLELYGCMWIFACVSTAGFVFTLLVVKETKGQNLDQVQQQRNGDENIEMTK